MTSSHDHRPPPQGPDAQIPAPETPALASEDLGLVDALAQLSFLVLGVLGEIAGRYDLSVVQTRLLGILRDREPTMNQLGRHLGLDKSSITGLVDRAQRRGLVTRTVSAVDRRAFQVSITDAGRQLTEQVAAEFAERIETCAAALPAADRKRLSRLATRVVTNDAHSRGIDLRTLTDRTPSAS
ncbi:transcriptional regulator, MarR family [Actinobacteria bacterium OK074]|nr:transcriptional regulator, MarR family [Actinobacteria bacterium OK074]